MQFPKFFAPFLESHMWTAVITVALLGLWLFGKRYDPLKSIVRRHPVLAALVDLFAAPLLIFQLGRFVHNVFARLDAVDFSAQINDVMLLVLLLSAAWNLARLAELFLLSIHKDDEAKYLPGLQRGLLFFVFLFLGLVMFLYLKGYSITGLYISTGAAAALVAFAMQQTLGDLFSGIALSIEHPFKLGERIRLPDGSEGKVVDINWRATRLLAWDNTTLVVPNSELAKQGFQNFHSFDHPYAPWYEVKVPAEIDPRLARALLLEAALRCDKVLKYPLPVVRLADATTVPYTYMVWVHYANYPAMFSGREQLFFEIHYALKDVGAQVSPPINELHSRRANIMEVDPPTTLLALKMLDITKSLSEEEVQELAEMSSRQSFDAGTTLVAEGDIAEYVDVVIHGVVDSSIKTKSGKLKSVDQLPSGQYFGLTSMLMGTPSYLQFTASTNVTLLRIDIDCLKSVLNGRPDLHNEFAAIMKQRMEAAQITRMASTKEDEGFTIRDFLRRIEKLTH